MRRQIHITKGSVEQILRNFIRSYAFVPLRCVQISPEKSKLTSVLTVPQDINLEQLIRPIFAGFSTKMLMFRGDLRVWIF